MSHTSLRLNKEAPLPQWFFAAFTGDRSGSMRDLDGAGASGLHEWFQTLKKSAKDNNQIGRISITTFDNQINRILENVDIKTTTFSKAEANSAMEPRGRTRLYDCCVQDIQSLLSNIENFRNSLPPAVKKLNPKISMTWVCCTDGFDNVSKFSKEEFCKSVTRAREYGVKCLFIATNQDAVMKGEEYGFNPEESLTFSANKNNAESAFQSMSQTIRSASTGASMAFTPAMRTASVDPYPLRDNGKKNYYLNMAGL